MDRQGRATWIAAALMMGIGLLAIVALLVSQSRGCGRQLTPFQMTLTAIPKTTDTQIPTAVATLTKTKTGMPTQTSTPASTSTLTPTPTPTETIALKSEKEPTAAVKEPTKLAEEEKKEATMTVQGKAGTPSPTETPVPGGNPDAGFPP